MTQRLTPKQEAQLWQIELAETPEIDTSRVVSDLAAHPELWLTAELSLEEETIEEYCEVGAEEGSRGMALYIAASGVDNDALMQLAIYWAVPSVGWISEEDGNKKRILRCWWETERSARLPN
jgi:hypothetical protein